MSSDDAYNSFLDQANQDTGAHDDSAKSGSATTKAVDTDVPAPLQQVDLYYTSEADEPFEPVSLTWREKDMPSENEFKDLVGHGSDVSTMSPREFDPHGQYQAVLEAVERSGDGKVRIFRVEHGSTRAEYYVVGHDQERQRIVGLKAKAVES
ncbi:hypothetical protein MMC07_005568 [Pseudocyphellaria aurata]|nr:hypothetical protein [Pseudocyphellaria aurata]